MLRCRRNARALLVTLCTAACMHALPAFAEGLEAPDGLEAIWRVQHFDFEFRSANVRYSCNGLRNKIGAILNAVGARKEMAVRIQCYRGELVNHARVRIALAAPVEATAENVLAATTFDTRAHLVAKMHNAQLPTAADVERFPAEWQTISLSRQRKLRLEAGDCELLHEMREQIFPKLSVRVTRNAPPCAVSATRLAPALEVAALMPVSAPSERARSCGSSATC